MGAPQPRDEDPPAEALRAVKYSYDWLRTWRYAIVQPSVKHVGFAAATFSNRRGRQVFPGVKRLMTITGLSKPAVIKSLRLMRQLGFLYRLSCAQGSNSGKADEYQLCVPWTLRHVPMADAKTGQEPVFSELPSIAQRTARLLGVAARLGEASGELSEPGSELTEPLVVVSGNRPWWRELTPPTHHTNTSTKSSDHHADRHDRADAGASARKYDFEVEDDCYEYVTDAFGDDLDPYEASRLDGMLASGSHPEAIVNAIRAGRGQAAA